MKSLVVISPLVISTVLLSGCVTEEVYVPTYNNNYVYSLGDNDGNYVPAYYNNQVSYSYNGWINPFYNNDSAFQVGYYPVRHHYYGAGMYRSHGGYRHYR